MESAGALSPPQVCQQPAGKTGDGVFGGRREPQVCSAAIEQMLSVQTGFTDPLLVYLQCGPEAAGVFGSSSSEEDQDPHPGRSNGCYRPGDGRSHPVHHPDSV